jgi:hypothetical protein
MSYYKHIKPGISIGKYHSIAPRNFGGKGRLLFISRRIFTDSNPISITPVGQKNLAEAAAAKAYR